MIKEHRRTFKVLRLGFDLALVVGCYYGIYLFSRYVANPLGFVVVNPDYPLRLPLILAFCWGTAFLASGAYDNTRRPGLWPALRISFKVLALMLFIFSVGLFAFKIQFLSRKFFFAYCLACWGLLSASKSTEFAMLRMLRGLGFNTLSVILVGGEKEMGDIWEEFQRHQEWGYRVVGRVAPAGHPGRRPSRIAAAPGLRVLGRVADLGRILRTRIVDELILAPSAPPAVLRAATREAAVAGVRVRVLVDPAFKDWKPQMDELGRVPVLAFSQYSSRPYQRIAKTALDFCGAGLLLLLLSPLWMLVSLAIRLSMGSPVLFKQKRAGQNGRAFTVYKFRTMVPEARRLQERLASSNQMGGPVFKIREDPRVTRLGGFLRKTSLDELPQLLNVLRGELSLVGPRPLAKYEARRVPAWAWRRYSVKPGITCLWQVSGRNELTFEQWMRLDLKYIDEWSLWMDFKILLRTLPAVLVRRGAY